MDKFLRAKALWANIAKTARLRQCGAKASNRWRRGDNIVGLEAIFGQYCKRDMNTDVAAVVTYRRKELL